MLKRIVLTVACLCLISLAPVQAQAFVGASVAKWVVTQVVKRVAKGAAIKYLDEGAEKKCLVWNRFHCVKVAK